MKRLAILAALIVLAAGAAWLLRRPPSRSTSASKDAPLSPSLAALPIDAGPASAAPYQVPGGSIAPRPQRPSASAEQVMAARKARTDEAPAAPRAVLDRAALGPLRRDLAAGLNRLQEKVAGCAGEGPGSPPPAGPRTLTLQVALLDGALRVDDAAPTDGAAPGDPRLACAQRALIGERIEAPTSRRGGTMQVSLPLRF